MKIVIPGGSGQVGRILARYFHAAGHEVTVLSRNPQPAQWRVASWDAAVRELEGSDVCINLAGRSVNCRYHPANRRLMVESRVDTTRALHEIIAALSHPPRVWLNASTATIYRHALDRAMDEVSGELGGDEAGAPEKWNFSIEVAKAWEAAFLGTRTPRTRKVAMRSAMTMSPDRGGVFDVLLRLVRYGLGGAQGGGAQYVSWVHELDFARAVEFLIEHDHFDGPVNIASPNPVPNAEFLRLLREVWGMRFGLPTPAWLLEIGAVFLRTETELVLKSRRVVPGRLTAGGFTFRFPQWPAAARELVDRWRVNH